MIISTQKTTVSIVFVIAIIFLWNTHLSTADEKDSVSQEEVLKELKILMQNAEAGDPKAQCEVGRYYDFGWGVEKDVAKALWWYKKAAEQGYIEAQVALGNLYSGGLSGYSYLTNEREACRWYLEAAKKGDSFSQAMVGEAYEKGKAVPRNYLSAVTWYQRAIEGGYFLAPYYLARLYANGMGVKKNLVQAYAWNSLSASTGNHMALSFQEKLESQMNRNEINTAQEIAASLYKQYGERIAVYIYK